MNPIRQRSRQSRSKSETIIAEQRRALYELLEDRVMFDAAIEMMPQVDVDGDNQSAARQDAASAQQFDASLFPEDVRMVADTSVNTPNRGQQNAREVLIIDQSVENYQQLMDDVLLKRGNVDVLLLDADDPDGIGQLRRLLAPYQDLNALHIVSHGTEDGIMLGQTHLTVDSLSAHAGDIAAWGQSLATGGDIMIYGCDLAGSADGRELLQSLRTLTGADIAASDDDTGLAARGGDWDMEYILGQTETSIVFSDTVRENWDGLLAPGPSVQLSAGNRSPQIGSDVQFTATFDNTAPAGSGDTGYGPFIDLLFPVDGVDGNGGEDTADGLKFKSAS
ncbi:MAG: DUF4347 domain-containing protein, partial [Planctomycetota bacterium]